MKTIEATEMLITINVVMHRDTKLMVATSPELRGLMVHGRSPEELNRRIPEAIKALLEAQGHRVDTVESMDDESPSSDFVPTVRKFHAIAA